MTQISAKERNNKLEAEEGGSSSRVGQNYHQDRLLGRISCKCSDRDQKRKWKEENKRKRRVEPDENPTRAKITISHDK